MNLIQQAQDLRETASMLRRDADYLTLAARRTDHEAVKSREFWIAPNGDQARQEVVMTAVRVSDQGDQLRQVAARLEARADEVEGQWRLFKQIEKNVRTTIDAFVRAAKPLPFTTPFDPRRLPPPGDPRWEKVGRLFGIR
jgi:hypothetical protein